MSCVKVAEAEARQQLSDQSNEYTKQIDELTVKLSEASSLITHLQQSQVALLYSRLIAVVITYFTYLLTYLVTYLHILSAVLVCR